MEHHNPSSHPTTTPQPPPPSNNHNNNNKPTTTTTTHHCNNHHPSKHNADVITAHLHRLSLTPPLQSSFRVVAMLHYHTTSSPPSVVIGTNDEPCHIAGSICAERAALLQLRFLPHAKVTKIVIVSDAPRDIAPGLLCREFLASHERIVPRDVVIVLGGSRCRWCDREFRPEEEGTTRHDYVHCLTTLDELYPHRSPYTGLSATAAVERGRRYAASSPLLDHPHRELLQRARDAARRDDRDELHPIRYGAAVRFDDGSIATAYQKKALEYGCTLDAVGQLAPAVVEKGEIRPVSLVQVDQFGVCHAPFAPGRAFFAEFGYWDCMVLVHDEECGELKEVSVGELTPRVPKLDDGILVRGGKGGDGMSGD